MCVRALYITLFQCIILLLLLFLPIKRVEFLEIQRDSFGFVEPRHPHSPVENIVINGFHLKTWIIALFFYFYFYFYFEKTKIGKHTHKTWEKERERESETNAKKTKKTFIRVSRVLVSNFDTAVPENICSFIYLLICYFKFVLGFLFLFPCSF